MLNDVHFPPDQSDRAAAPARARHNGHASHNGHANSGHAIHNGHVSHDENTSRVRNRLPTSTRSDVPEAIYGEPEDRGEAFNTLMSTAVVVIVLAVVVGLAWVVFL